MHTNTAETPNLTVTPRSEHTISRQSISDAALKVLYRLKNSGFRGCLVGGGVRDVLLDKKPKDFDISTDATPEEVRQLFRNSRIIGRRFRLVHIRFGREIIEVATFRSHTPDSSHTELDDEGRIIRDNSFGNIEQDALRRDFTVNALYYDIRDFSVLDYVNGLADIKSRTLRLIGDPATRYKEDPVRMLRAVRFAAKLNFKIDKFADENIFHFGHLLKDIPAARLFEEVVKLFHCGNAVKAFDLLRHYGLLKYLFPQLALYLENEPDVAMLDFLDQALINTDLRLKQGNTVSPAFIFASLLWPSVNLRAKTLESKELKIVPALHQAAKEIFVEQVKWISIPRRFSQTAKDIWTSQPRFTRTRDKQAIRFLSHPVFRASYDFMCIQTMVGLSEKHYCDWWTNFQTQHKVEKPVSPRKRRNRQSQKPTAQASQNSGN